MRESRLCLFRHQSDRGLAVDLLGYPLLYFDQFTGFVNNLPDFVLVLNEFIVKLSVFYIGTRHYNGEM